MGKLSDIKGLLQQAYATTLADQCQPENTQTLSGFEKKFNIKIPTDYRWLLEEFGACYFEDPWLYTIRDLDGEYPQFLHIYAKYQEGYTMPGNIDPFPIGGFGEGSLAFIDQVSGKIFMLIHDCFEDVPIEEIAGSFTELMERKARIAIEIEAAINGE